LSHPSRRARSPARTFTLSRGSFLPFLLPTCAKTRRVRILRPRSTFWGGLPFAILLFAKGGSLYATIRTVYTTNSSAKNGPSRKAVPEDAQKKKARTKRPAPSLIQPLSLFLASGTGGTTIGGRAACCIGCLHRSCIAECYHCDQQHCSNALHKFFSFEKSNWFLSKDGEAIPRESEAGFWCGVLNAQEARFEQGVSAAVKNGRDRLHGGINPHRL